MSFPRYPKYKDSGVEWLGEVPEEWRLSHIKHTTYLKARVGWKGLTSEEFRESGAALLVTGSDFRQKFVKWDECYQVEQEWYDNDPFIQLKNDDLLITKDGTIGKLAIVTNLTRPACLNSGIFVVRPLHTYITGFMYWILSSNVFKIFCDLRSFGSTINHLYQNVFEQFVFPTPTLEEQAAIADFLDRETAKIDALIAEQQRLMELLKEKRQAVISHAVTRGLNPAIHLKDSGIEWLGQVPEHWSLPKLKAVATFSGGGTPSRENLTFWNGNIPWVSPKDMKLESLMETEESITEDGLKNSASKLIASGHVLIVVRSGILKHTIPIAINQMPVALNQDMKALSFNGKVCNGLFFLRWVQGLNDKLLLAWAKQGATVESIEHSYLADTVVPLPDIQEQVEIASYLDQELSKFEDLSAEAQRAINLLQERRTALISAAVTGQIDVRESAIAPLTLVKPYSSGFARQLLAAEILDHCHQHPTMGRVKLQKLIHLCEHVAELEEVGAHDSRKAAGPFDNKVMFGIASGLSKQKWFTEVKDGNRTVYQPLEHAGEHRKYLTRWEDKMPQINKVLHLLGKADTQQCEIVSTLYAAWNDLLIEGQSPTDEAIIHEASSPDRWHENKAKILPEKWPKALVWMREKGLVPKGFGNHTSRPN